MSKGFLNKVNSISKYIMKQLNSLKKDFRTLFGNAKHIPNFIFLVHDAFA